MVGELCSTRKLRFPFNQLRSTILDFVMEFEGGQLRPRLASPKSVNCPEARAHVDQLQRICSGRACRPPQSRCDHGLARVAYSGLCPGNYLVVATL